MLKPRQKYKKKAPESGAPTPKTNKPYQMKKPTPVNN
jgi:hypothetical protein